MAKIVTFEVAAAIGDKVSFDGDAATPYKCVGLNGDVPPPALSGPMVGRVVGVTLAECGPAATGVWFLVEAPVGGVNLYELESFEASLV